MCLRLSFFLSHIISPSLSNRLQTREVFSFGTGTRLATCDVETLFSPLNEILEADAATKTTPKVGSENAGGRGCEGGVGRASRFIAASRNYIT